MKRRSRRSFILFKYNRVWRRVIKIGNRYVFRYGKLRLGFKIQRGFIYVKFGRQWKVIRRTTRILKIRLRRRWKYAVKRGRQISVRYWKRRLPITCTGGRFKIRWKRGWKVFGGRLVRRARRKKRRRRRMYSLY